MNKSILACLCASWVCHPCLSAVVANDSLDDVVVTATRNPQPVTEALEPVVLIDRATLENSLANDVGDVLRYHAGLDIGRSGGPGQPLSLFIRGANSDQSIVMIDGIRINAGTIGLAPLENIAPELFERIEVIKGPRSAIYGTDAIGGVVNLITRHGGASGGDVMLGYGRYATGQAAADGNYTDGDTSLRAAFSGQRSDGFPAFAGDSLDDGYKNLSGTAAASTKIGGVEVGALYWLSTGKTHYANPNYNDDFTAFASFTPLDERFINSALGAYARGDITENWHARVTASRNVDDLRQNQLDIYSVVPAGDFEYTARDTLDLQNDIAVAAGGVTQLITFGAIVASEHTATLSYGTPYSLGTHTQTYYVQDQLSAGAHRLLVAGGYYHHPAFGDHETWNAEYGFALTPRTLLIASFGTAFRAPSATDRFGYGGTPDLKPESSRNVEVGVKWRPSTTQFVTLAAFQNSINDLIVFVSDPLNVIYGGENQNIDRARIRGVELSWEMTRDLWSVRAEASVQDPRNLSVQAADSQLLRRTKHSVTVAASRHVGAGEFGIDVLQAGAREDLDVVSGARARDGGYVLAALRAKWSLSSAWSVSARLDNALDRHYQLANGYNTQRRSMSIAARYAFP